MESLLSGLSQHGYSILFAMVFLEAVAMPVPAALALLIAGGASARGSLQPLLTAAMALSAMILGDLLMFLLGRYTGWWLLGLLCRLSLNPESCVLRTADSFHRRGRLLLLFAKFVPGINTMAPPLAGSMNMRFLQFLRFDLVGATLYVGSYLAVGFVFSDILGSVTRGYQAFARLLGWIVVAAVAAYLLYQFRMWRKARDGSVVPFVEPSEAARAVASGQAVIYDVRSHGYYDRNAKRIGGSIRLDPNALHQSGTEWPPGKLVYLYCTCVRQATSTRVAHLLLDKGVSSAVIRGGLGAWKKAGLPLEPVPPHEIAAMPAFES